MSDSDPISSTTRPHAVREVGDADPKRDDARKRRKKRRKQRREPAPPEAPPGAGEDGPAPADEERPDARGRHVDVKV